MVGRASRGLSIDRAWVSAFTVHYTLIRVTEERYTQHGNSLRFPSFAAKLTDVLEKVAAGGE